MTARTEAFVQLQALEDALLRWEDGRLEASALGDQARASHALWSALPERYGPVLLQLLDRLETSALFTEESCSFSPGDVRSHVHAWVAKARQQLEIAT